MAHTLPPLAYPYSALEPYIDEATVRLHHEKHHAAYVNNLNAVLQGYPDLQSKSVEWLLRNLLQLPDEIRTAVRNNAGAHQAHTIYFQTLAPRGARVPGGPLATAINRRFGGFSEFKEKLFTVGMNRFGSGWAWLVVTSRGDLALYSTDNADSPCIQGDTPILALDVWEHAYYLKYQNRRADYIKAFFNVINWEAVAERYSRAMSAF